MKLRARGLWRLVVARLRANALVTLVWPLRTSRF